MLYRKEEKGLREATGHVERLLNLCTDVVLSELDFPARFCLHQTLSFYKLGHFRHTSLKSSTGTNYCASFLHSLAGVWSQQLGARQQQKKWCELVCIMGEWIFTPYATFYLYTAAFHMKVLHKGRYMIQWPNEIQQIVRDETRGLPGTCFTHVPDINVL